MNYAIYPPEELIEDAILKMPPSKSFVNRTIILDALTPGHNIADASGMECDDIKAMHEAVATITNIRNNHTTEPTAINVGNAGTAMRFLTALIAATPGIEVELSGSERMHQRPIGPLVDALRTCGAEIEYMATDGFPPLRIKGKTLYGGTITVDATVSSQFVSALLMTAPTMRDGLILNLDGEPVSLPYILMTLEMMRRRGINHERTPLTITVAPGQYKAFTEPAEGDWSAAAYWYEVTAVSAGWITLEGLDTQSIQGDIRTQNWFERLGVVTVPSEEHPGAIDLQPSPEVFGRLDADLCDTPDLAPSLAVTCCLLGIPFKFTGLQSLGIKECDRLEAIVKEMEKIGCTVEKVRDFGLEWDGRRHPIVEMPIFETYGDHRMAMALAPVAAYIPGIIIRDAEVTDKSYPGFWEAMRSLGFELKEAIFNQPEETSAE